MARWSAWLGALSLAWVATTAGCKDTGVSEAGPVEPVVTAQSLAASSTPSCGPAHGPAVRPAADRVVAIGDLHGDLASTLAVFGVAGLVDGNGTWIGKDTVVVQTGDILDRGGDELEILEWLDGLRGQAKASGGALVTLNGNHELMNVSGDMRYVTRESLSDFGGSVATRVREFAPGGRWAMHLARNNTVVQVGDTVFAHGGVLPNYARLGLEATNREIRCWMAGVASTPGMGADHPTWSRDYSSSPERCGVLAEALSTLGAVRMVVGHTTHTEGITAACDDRVYRIDVGLADFYGGPTQALEITAAGVRVLK